MADDAEMADAEDEGVHHPTPVDAERSALNVWQMRKRARSTWCADRRCWECTGIATYTVTDGSPLSSWNCPCGCPCHYEVDDGDPGQRTNPFTGRAWDED